MDVIVEADNSPIYPKVFGRLFWVVLALVASSGCGDAAADQGSILNAATGHGSGSGILVKSNIYKVTGQLERGTNEEGRDIVFAVAACADNDDILFNGGCRFEPSGVPADPISIPQHNDDLSQPAQWYCQIKRGDVTAEAFCLTVNTP